MRGVGPPWLVVGIELALHCGAGFFFLKQIMWCVCSRAFSFQGGGHGLVGAGSGATGAGHS